jgi:hypothetical protein
MSAGVINREYFAIFRVDDGDGWSYVEPCCLPGSEFTERAGLVHWHLFFVGMKVSLGMKFAFVL